MFRDHGCNVYLAAEIKKHVSKPVATIGGLSDPAQMEEIIASGKADIVVMGRGLLADPELPNKVMSNRGDEVVKCLRCFVCMAERPVTQTRRCAVNPLIGREIEGMRITPALERRRVLVVGGGIAGMVAAYTAAKRGHGVTLCEASDKLGGILRLEQALPFKHEMYELGCTYELLCRRAGVDIRLNTPVDAAFAEELAADAAIVAVGSEAKKPPFPIADGARVLSIEDLHIGGKEAEGEVVVAGAGLTGCECALHLAHEGKSVHLIASRSELAIDCNIRNRPILLAEIEAAGIDVRTGARVARVEKGQVVCTTSEGEIVVPADTVVSAIGQRSRIEAVDELRDAAPFVRIVGDAVRPGTITAAVYQAYHAALDI